MCLPWLHLHQNGEGARLDVDLCWQHPRIQQPVGLLTSLLGQRHDVQAMHTRHREKLQEGRWVTRIIKL